MSEKPLTYNDVPQALGYIMEKIDSIEKKLQPAQPSAEEQDRVMTPQQLHDYLDDHPTIATIYTWSSRGRIPSEKNGKYLLFRKSVIDAWVAAGRPRRQDQYTDSAVDYVNRKRMGL